MHVLIFINLTKQKTIQFTFLFLIFINFIYLFLIIFLNDFLFFRSNNDDCILGFLLSDSLDVVEEEIHDDDVERLSDLGNRYFVEDEDEFVDIFISFP